MKTIRFDMPMDIESAEIIPLADFHIGDAMSDWQYIQSVLKHIKETLNDRSSLRRGKARKPNGKRDETLRA